MPKLNEYPIGSPSSEDLIPTLKGGALKLATIASIGLIGPGGPPGAQGPQGIPGNDGAQGLPGNDGMQGLPGNDGAQGVPGNDGAQGLQGIPGLQGDQGIAGNDGAQGIPGNNGADGAQGIQGIQGPQGPSGVPMRVPFATPILAALVWTNMPAAASFFLSTATVAKNTVKVDLTNFTQTRLLVNKQATAGAASSKLILKYKASPFTQVVANYVNIGTSEVSVAVNVQNTFLETAWITLAAGAKADVYVDIVGQGGDGALDPAFGSVVAEFK